MLKYEVFYNKTYKNSCDLVQEIKRGRYLYIDKVNDIILIDNVKIADLEEVNCIKFLVNGYYQVIYIASPHTKIIPTEIQK